MRAHRPLAAVGLVALGLTTAGCHGKSTASPTSTAAAPAASTSPAATAPAAGAPAVASGSGAVTFDGSYSGTLTTIVCIGSGPTTTASFSASYTGNVGYPGNIDSREFGFEGPDNTQFDSGFLSTALDTDGAGFVLDGIVVKDPSGKSLTMHGTLHCP